MGLWVIPTGNASCENASDPFPYPLNPELSGVRIGPSNITPLHVQANRCQLVSRVADDLAHEIKNPLNAVVINLELLRRRVSSGAAEEALERARIVGEEVERVNRLTEDLLLVLRSGKSDPARLDIPEFLQQLNPLLAILVGLSRAEFRLSVPAEEFGIRLSRSSLRLVLLNLVVNAIDALPPTGGVVSIEATISNDELAARVTDNGSGIAPALLPRLGQPGATSRPDRAGLGLAVASHLLSESGARLELRSAGENGGDTTFEVIFPRARLA